MKESQNLKKQETVVIEDTEGRSLFARYALFLAVAFVFGGLGYWFLGPEDSTKAIEKVADGVKLQFDGRPWKLAHRASDKGVAVMEYIPEGTALDSWSELITVQTFSSVATQEKPADLANRVKSLIKSRCGDKFFDLGTIEKDGEVFYEWYTEKCPQTADQHELVRISKGEKALHSIHYAIRQGSLPDTERQKWVALISSAVVPR